MTIPLSASELSEFTPHVLRNLAVPPVFVFRPVTERDTREFLRQCKIAGLKNHNHEAQRDAIRAELRILWDAESFEREMPRLEGLWAALDQNAGVDPESPDYITIDEAELTAANALMARLFESSERMRRMAVDNEAFFDDAPKIAFGMFVQGWKNIDAPFRREAGMVPLTVVDGVEKALHRLQTQALADKIEGVGLPGDAFLELALHAFGLMNLTGDESGNSASPSATSATPNFSRTDASPPQTAAGGSLGGAPSKKTRRRG